ncbi:hypothetical protein AWB85_21800 [Mycobacteroides immunogenum]|uniref:Uncharacterized protein n=1 Tax=Mycobacteroides immunogenum TaxID=83262 RepID=A0A179VBZ4_9MYCO|nr:hypothetical protein [Mycobacteroides immunogenum]OAT69399.1 hypothetical protein AWB85_21800 [Mycobacteroides immunogenum]
MSESLHFDVPLDGYRQITSGLRQLALPANCPLAAGDTIRITATDYSWPNGLGRAIGPADVPAIEITLTRVTRTGDLVVADFDTYAESGINTAPASSTPPNRGNAR